MANFGFIFFVLYYRFWYFISSYEKFMKNKQDLYHSDLIKILDEIELVVDDIKSIKIQWATNVARAAFTVLRQGLLAAKFSSKEEFSRFLHDAVRLLVESRPTEPLLQNGMKYALWIYTESVKKQLDELVLLVDDALQDLLDRIREGDVIRSEVWAELFKDWIRAFTHCHSGSVVKVVRKAWESGKRFEMVNTETRPLYQGRITAQDLLDIGVPTTLITDDMWPYYIDDTTPDTPKIDFLILWCDAIKPDGSVVNKVGSFWLALSAYHSGVPVYVVASFMKMDMEDKVRIELRDGSEIWPHAPKGLNILNFAFDTIPAKFVTWFITRFGIVKPENMNKIVLEKYPWMK